MTTNRIPQYMIEDVNHLYRSIYEGSKGDGDLANNYPPYDKVTRGDVIAGAKGEDQMGGTSRLKDLMSRGMTRKEALAQIDKEKKEKSVKESYDLDQLSILYLVKEGYAKDLRSAQVIYENASSGFKRELNEIAPALVALAARALPSAGRLLASSTGKSLMSKGKNILKDPRVRQLGKYALDQISSNKNGEEASNDDSSNSTNSGLLSGFLRSATGATMNASYDYGEADGIEESFYDWVDDLFEDGYDLSNYTWEGLFEYYCDLLSEVTGKESLMNRQLKPSPTAPKPAPAASPTPAPGANTTTSIAFNPNTNLSSTSSTNYSSSLSNARQTPSTFNTKLNSGVKPLSSTPSFANKTTNFNPSSFKMPNLMAKQSPMDKWRAANPNLAKIQDLRQKQKEAGKSIYDPEFRDKVVNPIMRSNSKRLS